MSGPFCEVAREWTDRVLRGFGPEKARQVRQGQDTIEGFVQCVGEIPVILQQPDLLDEV